jgi:hypothetical protein
MARIAGMIVAAAFALFASDTITLRDGSVHYGTFLGSSGQMVTIDEKGTRQTFDLRQVRSIQFDPMMTSSTAARAGQNTARGPASGANPGGAMIPSGSAFVVRTNARIQSDTASTGRFYSATVERDVTDRSRHVVIPRGSTAQMVVRKISASRAPVLALGLQSVTVNGRTYRVSGQRIQRSGQGASKPAADLGGSAGSLGTVVRAVTNVGKGAMGALTASEIVVTGRVFIGGKTVNVPAETTLTFRLDHPLYLQGM